MKNNNKGFTLIELVIVITIVSLLLTVSFISLTTHSDEAKVAKQNRENKYELCDKLGGIRNYPYNTCKFIIGDTPENIEFKYIKYNDLKYISNIK